MKNGSSGIVTSFLHSVFFFFQAEDGIRDLTVTGVQTCALPIYLPPFPSSAMDGFAVRALDAPARLPVVARIAAGVPAPRALEPGEAMAIATGGEIGRAHV